MENGRKYKKFNTIILIAIIFICNCSIILNYFYNYCSKKYPVQDETSISREIKNGDIYIILNPEVPLGISEESKIGIEIFNEINEYRKEMNLPEFIWNTDLEVCATIRAQEAKELWSHTRPNGLAWYTVNECLMYGENLAKGYFEASEVVEAWKASPTHNENLINPDFKYIAISKIGNYYAAEFCY